MFNTLGRLRKGEPLNIMEGINKYLKIKYSTGKVSVFVQVQTALDTSCIKVTISNILKHQCKT